MARHAKERRRFSFSMRPRLLVGRSCDQSDRRSQLGERPTSPIDQARGVSVTFARFFWKVGLAVPLPLRISKQRAVALEEDLASAATTVPRSDPDFERQVGPLSQGVSQHLDRFQGRAS